MRRVRRLPAELRSVPRPGGREVAERVVAVPFVVELVGGVGGVRWSVQVLGFLIEGVQMTMAENDERLLTPFGTQRLDRPVHSPGAEFGSPSRRRRGPQSTSHVHSPTQDDSARLSVAIWSFICQPKPWSARRSRCSERSASLHWSEPGRSARPRTSCGWASALVVPVGSPRRLGVGDPALQRLGIHTQLLTDPALRSDLAAGRAERRAPS